MEDIIRACDIIVALTIQLYRAQRAIIYCTHFTGKQRNILIPFCASKLLCIYNRSHMRFFLLVVLITKCTAKHAQPFYYISALFARYVVYSNIAPDDIITRL